MRNKTRLIVVLIAVVSFFILVVYFNNNSIRRTSAEERLKTDDTSSYQPIINTSADEQDLNSGSFREDHWTLDEPKTSSLTAKKTFTEAFRNFHFFLGCDEVVQLFNEKNNPMSFVENKKRQIQRYGSPDVGESLSHFKKFISKCQKMMIDSSETFHEAAKRLKKDLFQTEPLSKAELDLFEYLLLIDDILTVEDQLSQFESQEKTSMLTKEWTLLVNELLKSLKGNHSPDVFYITFLSTDMVGYFPRIEQELFDLTHSIAELGLNQQLLNHSYLNQSYSVTLRLSALPSLLCDLGYPCGQDSLIMTDLCIHNGITNACGQSVEEYYKSHYISPNSLGEVMLFLNAMVEMYFNHE
jgi:hypothetical protein